MAGMLPGVEAARRRRFHQKSNNNINYYGSEITQTRRSSFSLYASTHDFHLCSTSSMQRNPMRQVLYDESTLGAEAREAKKRLDERLQPQWRTQTKRTSKGERSLRFLQDRATIQADSQAAEVPKLKKSGSKRLKWLKLSWKSSNKRNARFAWSSSGGGGGNTNAVALCGHRFHTNCLVPWLESNAHCPCCRMEIPAS
ncbi:hypothetical protein DH2020_034384 [Rehmannia glutinosa]|uniref:RING-type domain-containing protein n=1 Tax=Rehmannia glutinosa TaxID=99300 RepID=A0ABR0VCK2_REHGL